DITECKRVERALQEQQTYLRLVLDNIPQQVFWKDTNLVFRGCNKNWASSAHLARAEDAVGKTDYDLLPSREIADFFRARDRQTIESNTPQLHTIISKQRPDVEGKVIWLDVSRIPMHDACGNTIGVIGVLEDITQRKEAEEALRQEQAKSERLLLNVLPREIAAQLKEEEGAIASAVDEATVLFADIVGFTSLSVRLSATELVDVLNQIFSEFDRLAETHGLEKIKTIGDAYMVAGGIPLPIANSAEAIAQMALDMQRAIARFKTDRGETFQIRIGINTGPVVAGVIGIKKFIYDLWGDTVNVASRMESTGVPGGIQVTEATYLQLQERYRFERRGIVDIKGKGQMETYWLVEEKNRPDY
ncbi:PAS domain-containing protein, partial [Oscillatoriales cyanobacterium LEGE 11467]